MKSSAGLKAAQMHPHLSTCLGCTNISIPADFSKLKSINFYFLSPFWERYWPKQETPYCSLGLGSPSTPTLFPLTLARCLSPGNSLGWICQSDWSCCYGLFLHFQMPVKRGRCHCYTGKATALRDFHGHHSQLNLGDFPIISHQKTGDGESFFRGSQNNLRSC